MVTLRLGPEDVANLRFAISPLMELHTSVRALEHPEAKALHLPWVAATRERVADIDMALLHALQPRRPTRPTSSARRRESPLGELEEELEEMLATPPEQVRLELRRAYEGRALPAVLEPLLAIPARELPALADLFRAYWERALAPQWPRIRALLEGDILYRARRLADGGAQRLFADIHPRCRSRRTRCGSTCPTTYAPTSPAAGWCSSPARSRGRARRARSSRRGSRPSSTPRAGSAALWEPGRTAPPAALAALLGARRATVLARARRRRARRPSWRRARALPRQRLPAPSVLRDAGLVHGHRVGRAVLYVRSEKGEGLVR